MGDAKAKRRTIVKKRLNDHTLTILRFIFKCSYFITDINDELLQLLEKEDNFDRDHLNNVLREFSDLQNMKYKHFMKSMRSILSGHTVSI